MTWLSRVGRALTGKSNLAELTISQLADLFAQPTRARVQVGRDQALQVTAFLCGLRVIAEGLAQMPIRVRRREGARHVDVPDHPVAALLDRPNEWQSRHEFIETLALICALDGNFYAIKNGPADNRISELLPLPPGTTSVRRRNYELIYTVGDGERVVGEFRRDRILHVRGPSIDTFRGISPVQAAREALGLTIALERQQAQLSGNGGRPSGILYSDQPQSPTNADAVRHNWNRAFGAGGEGGVAVLDLGWKFAAIAATSEQNQAIEHRQHQILEVARALRVFPQMLMAESQGSTFASAEQFFRAHVIHTLGPWMSRIEGAFHRDLLAGQPDLKVDFDERRMLRGDFKDRATYLATMLGAGGVVPVMSRNEAREFEGLDPTTNAEDDVPMPRLGSEPAGDGRAA